MLLIEQVCTLESGQSKRDRRQRTQEETKIKLAKIEENSSFQGQGFSIVSLGIPR